MNRGRLLQLLSAAILCWALGIAAGLNLPASPVPAAGKQQSMGRPTTTDVFGANMKVLAGCMLGLLTGGTCSIVTLILNGMYLGLQWHLFSARVSGWRSLALLAPHGILEIPGILIGGAVGMMGIPILRSLCRNDIGGLRRHIPPILAGALLSVCLIILGAIAESWFISRL
jgi:uncharacterized membrane protein SpoIIM required for sporulation